MHAIKGQKVKHAENGLAAVFVCGDVPENLNTFKLLYYRIWIPIRDVFWLGPPAPKVLGSYSKNTDQIQILGHFEKREERCK